MVHDYGDVCQAVTELAVERKATITAEEFHTLNLSLDVAMAEAVTEYSRQQQDSISRDEVERRGQLAHELRNKVHTALLSLQMLKTGKVGIGGSTGAVLTRSLIGLRDLIEQDLSQVRLEAGIARTGSDSIAAVCYRNL